MATTGGTNPGSGSSEEEKEYVNCTNLFFGVWMPTTWKKLYVVEEGGLAFCVLQISETLGLQSIYYLQLSKEKTAKN